MTSPLVSSTALPAGLSDIAGNEHFVQFYGNEDHFLDALAGYMGAGLQTGEGCIAIATEAHRLGLEQRLATSGLNVASAIETGQYIALDAATTLSRFMGDGEPNPNSFATVVGALLEGASQGGRPVRAFGEMVALLWREGNKKAASRLEELWNDISKRYRFALFCAYPLIGFHRADDANAFADICTQHSHVIPDDGYAARLPSVSPATIIALLQQKAMALEAEIVERKNVEERLARREKELADFLENSVVGLHQVGPDGTILWANKAELNLLGYASEEYIGHHIAEFHVDHEVIQDILAKLLCGESICDYPGRLRCKDGSIKDVLIHSNGSFKDGTFLHTRCFTTDVTERKHAERERDQFLDALQKERLQLQNMQRELQEKISDLEIFHDVAVDRELKMMALEKELIRLRQENEALKAKQAPRHNTFPSSA